MATIKEKAAEMRRNYCAVLDGFDSEHRELGVELGYLKKVTDPETGETYYYVGLPVDDFYEFVIHSVLGHAEVLRLRRIHRRLLQDEPDYVARFREAELKRFRRRK